jgi:hypothetical protein
VIRATAELTLRRITGFLDTGATGSGALRRIESRATELPFKIGDPDGHPIRRLTDLPAS